VIQPYLDRVIAWATGPERQEEILRAKEQFRQATGEFHEDDRSFEPRMAAFLEYYLFDRSARSTACASARCSAARITRSTSAASSSA